MNIYTIVIIPLVFMISGIGTGVLINEIWQEMSEKKITPLLRWVTVVITGQLFMESTLFLCRMWDASACPPIYYGWIIVLCQPKMIAELQSQVLTPLIEACRSSS